MHKIGLNNFKGGGVGFGGGGLEGGLEGGGLGWAWTEFAVVVGCSLFGKHFSHSKNALLLNFYLFQI